MLHVHMPPPSPSDGPYFDVAQCARTTSEARTTSADSPYTRPNGAANSAAPWSFVKRSACSSFPKNFSIRGRPWSSASCTPRSAALDVPESARA